MFGPNSNDERLFLVTQLNLFYYHTVSITMIYLTTMLVAGDNTITRCSNTQTILRASESKQIASVDYMSDIKSV